MQLGAWGRCDRGVCRCWCAVGAIKLELAARKGCLWCYHEHGFLRRRVAGARLIEARGVAG